MLLCTLHTVAWGNLVSPSQLGAGPMQGGALGPQAPPLLSPAFSLDGWRMDLVLDPNLTGTPCALSLFMELGLVPDFTAPPPCTLHPMQVRQVGLWVWQGALQPRPRQV